VGFVQGILFVACGVAENRSIPFLLIFPPKLFRSSSSSSSSSSFSKCEEKFESQNRMKSGLNKLEGKSLLYAFITSKSTFTVFVSESVFDLRFQRKT
jgi:hypothetical protein